MHIAYVVIEAIKRFTAMLYNCIHVNNIMLLLYNTGILLKD